MSFAKSLQYFLLALVAYILVGCSSIPPEQQKNYALIQSGVAEGISSAPVAYINGHVQFPATSSANVLPGQYQFQLGLNCGNTATCHPSRPYELVVEAGKMYVLLAGGTVMVSDRFNPRKNEVLYRAPTN